METLSNDYGTVQYAPRDLALWPRNAKPPTIDVSRLRGFTAHYAGGSIASYYKGRTVEEGDRLLIGATIREHNSRPGMSDVGYNFFLGRSGIAYEGRGPFAMNAANGPLLSSVAGQYPAGTTTSNPYWCSVFLCVGTDLIDATPAQWSGARVLIRSLALGYGLGHPSINGHRDVRATACPGEVLYRRLGELVAPPAPTPCEPANPIYPEWGIWPNVEDKPTVSYGSTGPVVAYLNGVLRAYGYTATAPPDRFLDRTRGAVEHVQRSNRLTPDSIVGRATWDVIDALALKAHQ